MTLGKKIANILLFGLLLATSGSVHAQRLDAKALMRAQRNGQGNLYGSNPYEQQQDDEEQPGRHDQSRNAASASRSNPTFSTIRSAP